jgi:hypothetical protein
MSGAELTSSEYRCELVSYSTSHLRNSNATYDVVFILKVRIVLLHRGVDGLEGRHQVVEDGSPPCLAFWLAESTCINDAHLLEHCRLATLTSTYRPVSAEVRGSYELSLRLTEQQELHLTLCPLPVDAQALFNVLILPELRVRGFPSKAHDRWCHSRQLWKAQWVRWLEL